MDSRTIRAHSIITRTRWIAISWLCGLLAVGCGHHGSSPADGTTNAPTDATDGTASIGSAGGTVTLSSGPTLVIPPGALATDVTITISVTPQQVSGAVSPVFQFAPAGLAFAVPATVTIPITASDNELRVYWSQASGSGYDELPSQVAADGVSASVVHFSTGYVAPRSPSGTDYHYTLDHMDLPTNNMQASQYGLDLDGNGTVDNEFGAVLGTLASIGLDSSGNNASAVSSGAVLVHADLQAADFVSAQNAGFTTYLGAAPTDAPLLGDFASGTLSAGPGHLAIQLEINPNRPIELNLIGARVQVSGSASGLSSSILAGAIVQSQVDGVLVPELAFGFNSIVGADCTRSGTGCGCVSGSNGQNIIGEFDTNKDCMIETSELQNNNIIQSFLAPDVMAEGQRALSFGIGFSAVAAP